MEIPPNRDRQLLKWSYHLTETIRFLDGCTLEDAGSFQVSGAFPKRLATKGEFHAKHFNSEGWRWAFEALNSSLYIGPYYLLTANIMVLRLYAHIPYAYVDIYIYIHICVYIYIHICVCAWDES